mmetsp:Transcript_27778/g.50740  ORF Transcript_27778/g.50740 Transcript_27778/m.50740 type:complete len:213 (-) Transcript_27778:48-686(-)
MGALCCCELDASQVSLAQLKLMLEGDTKKVNTNPEVLVRIDEVLLKDGGAFKFTPNKFTLNGLHIKTTVTVKGTPAEIASLTMKQQGTLAFNAAGVPKDNKVRTMLRGVADSVTKLASQGGAIGMSNERSVKVNCVVNMVKHFGDERVQVTVTSFDTDVAVFKQLLGVDYMRQFIEKAISDKASEVATRLAKNEYNGKMKKLGLGPQVVQAA